MGARAVTVADRIRFMSDHELALFLSRLCYSAYKIGLYGSSSTRSADEIRSSFYRKTIMVLRENESARDWSFLKQRNTTEV